MSYFITRKYKKSTSCKTDAFLKTLKMYYFFFPFAGAFAAFAAS